MIVHHGVKDFNKPSFPVVTSGTFDGVHFGHRKILDRLINIADENNGESIVLTYWPHPRFVINKNNSSELRLLSSFEEKCDLLQNAGIDHLIKLPFTRSFSEMSSQDFIKQILVDGIGTKKLVIGYDHRFGKNREGGFEYLKENANSFGFGVEEIPKQDVDNVGVSSTKIREALKSGNVDIAASFLGKPYSINGVVVTGNKLGRQIGFPTANIEIFESLKLVPGDGVYAVTIDIDKTQYKGMMNIGLRPTVHGRTKTLEVNIFDFDQNIYGHKVRLNFIKKLRNEMRFSDIESLSNQLKDDYNDAKKALVAF